MQREESKVDDRGRIVIPIKYRKFFPQSTRVGFIPTNNGILVNFEGSDEVEFLTLEYLQNQLTDVRKDIRNLTETMRQLRKMAFETLIKAPDNTKEMIEVEK